MLRFGTRYPNYGALTIEQIEHSRQIAAVLRLERGEAGGAASPRSFAHLTAGRGKKWEEVKPGEGSGVGRDGGEACVRRRR